METVLITGSIYFISIIIYNNVSFFKKYLIQPSIISGLILLILGTNGISLISQEIHNELKTLPSILISFLFSGIILSNPEFNVSKRFYFRVLRQGVFVWIIAILQLLVGFTISYFYFEKDSPYLILGSLIEIGWLGGHGSAAAFSGFVKQLNIPEVGDLAIISATIGLIWGNISGIILVNFFIKNWLKKSDLEFDNFAENKENQFNIHKIVYGIVIPIIPVTISYYLKKVLGFFLVLSEFLKKFIEQLPLFFIVIVISFFLREILFKSLRKEESIFVGIKIFTGIILDILIISAIATLNLNVVIESIDIIILYSLGGILISLIVFFISPFFVEEHPEISIINYGMTTGTTATGLMLLNSFKNINDKSSQLAIIVYGSAAPLSAPFIGGGIISLLIPFLIHKGYFYLLFAIFWVILIILIIISFSLKKYTKNY